MKKITFETIEDKINIIKEVNQEAGNMLHSQLFFAANCEWSMDELSEYMKSDCDVIDQFDCENISDDIREIQDSIIYFFGN